MMPIYIPPPALYLSQPALTQLLVSKLNKAQTIGLQTNLGIKVAIHLKYVASLPILNNRGSLCSQKSHRKE